MRWSACVGTFCEWVPAQRAAQPGRQVHSSSPQAAVLQQIWTSTARPGVMPIRPHPAVTTERKCMTALNKVNQRRPACNLLCCHLQWCSQCPTVLSMPTVHMTVTELYIALQQSVRCTLWVV